MTTPSEPAGGSDTGSGSDAPGDVPFDPYRFGKPDHPIPPQYAPPGYTPDPPQAPQPWSYGQQPGPSGQTPQYGQQFPPYPSGGYGVTPPGAYGGYPQPSAGNGKATAGLVLGIVSIVMFWLTFFNVIFLILALIFGVLGLKESKLRHGVGRGMAIGGLICTAVGLVATVIMSAVVVNAVNKCGGFSNSSAPGFQTCVRDEL